MRKEEGVQEEITKKNKNAFGNGHYDLPPSCTHSDFISWGQERGKGNHNSKARTIVPSSFVPIMTMCLCYYVLPRIYMGVFILRNAFVNLKTIAWNHLFI